MSIYLSNLAIYINGDYYDYEGKSDDEYATQLATKGVTQASLDYERDVKTIVVDIARKKTGAAVFHKVKAHGLVEIRPYEPRRHAKYGHCQALTYSGTGRLAHPHLPGVVASGGMQSLVLGKPVVMMPLEFSPKTWAGSSSCFPGKPGFKADEVLLHELVHAGRGLGHEEQEIPLSGALQAFENETEYFAVLVANIYMSECGRTTLRGGHNDSALSPSLTNPENYMKVPEHYALVEKYCSQHPTIAPMIAQAPAPFNPLYVYYKWKAFGYQ